MAKNEKLRFAKNTFLFSLFHELEMVLEVNIEKVAGQLRWEIYENSLYSLQADEGYKFGICDYILYLFLKGYTILCFFWSRNSWVKSLASFVLGTRCHQEILNWNRSSGFGINGNPANILCQTFIAWGNLGTLKLGGTVFIILININR